MNIKRWITTLVGLPIAIVLMILGGVPMQIILTLFSLIGLYEFYGALSKKFLPVHTAGYAFTLIYYFLVTKLNNPMFLLLTYAFFLLVILIMLVMFYKTVNIIDCAVTILGFYYIPVLFSFVYMVREYSLGSYLIWIIFICAWGSDSGAYIFGKLFGKHKLAPDLSPKKTIEGAIGGIFTASVLAFIYALIMIRIFPIEDTVPIIAACTISGGVGSVFAQFGDLAASAIKRHSNVKDFGDIIPGHGGIIDRFDSVLFTAPCVFIFIQIFF